MPESDRSTRLRWVHHPLVLFMAVWAAGQLVVVQTRGLSSWRSGGFGMYAGFHPVHRDAWVIGSAHDRDDGSVSHHDSANRPFHFQKHVSPDPDMVEADVALALYTVVRPHLTFPRLDRLRSDLSDSAGRESSKLGRKHWAVKITEPRFDLESLVLTRATILDTTTGSVLLPRGGELNRGDPGVPGSAEGATRR